jgi:hypothetical protein
MKVVPTWKKFEKRWPTGHASIAATPPPSALLWRSHYVITTWLVRAEQTGFLEVGVQNIPAFRAVFARKNPSCPFCQLWPPSSCVLPTYLRQGLIILISDMENNTLLVGKFVFRPTNSKLEVTWWHSRNDLKLGHECRNLHWNSKADLVYIIQTLYCLPCPVIYFTFALNPLDENEKTSIVRLAVGFEPAAVVTRDEVSSVDRLSDFMLRYMGN